MPNAPFAFTAAPSGGSEVVIACPDVLNYISVLGFRLSAAGTVTAEWDEQTLSGHWTFLQANYASANTTSNLAVTYKQQVTKGDLLTAYSVSVGVGNSCTISDSQANTWTQVGPTATYKSSTYNGQMWQTVAGATGINTVTMTPVTTGLQALVIVEVIPPTGTVAADSASKGTGTSGTMSTGTVTVTGNNELLCGFFNDTEPVSGVSYAPGAGLTQGYYVSDPTFGQFLFIYNPNASVSAAVTVAITGGSPSWAAVGGSFSFSGNTTVDGPYQIGTGCPVSVPQNDQQPVFDLRPGMSLVLTTNTNVVVSGGVTYAIRQVAGGNPFN
jgi:hypothetical protein